MMKEKPAMAKSLGLLALTTAMLAACSGAPSPVAMASDPVQSSVQPANFLAAGLKEPITTVNCTLSGGASTTCFKIVTQGAPKDHAVGPFCPTHITSAGAGMWIESGKTYDLTGEFIKNLDTFYKDSRWKMYDPATGKITITDTQDKFARAAVPQVPADLANHCVEGKMSYVGGGKSNTFLIPVKPVPESGGAGRIGRGGVGVALNGILIDAPAPVRNILAGLAIAAFDDCGGHVNPHAGYHYHAQTGCTHKVASADGHAALIGYALDGYGIHALADTGGAEPSGLDECRGHSDSVRGYHYHAASPGENMHIGCFKGQQGSAR